MRFAIPLLFILVNNLFSVVESAQCNNKISQANCNLLLNNGYCLSEEVARTSCSKTCGNCFSSQREKTRLNESKFLYHNDYLSSQSMCLFIGRKCTDLSTKCEDYKNQCTQAKYETQMKKLCSETCDFDFCTNDSKRSESDCKDVDSTKCQKLKNYCTDKSKQDVLREYCPSTCEFDCASDSNENEDCEDKDDACALFKALGSQQYCGQSEIKALCPNTCGNQLTIFVCYCEIFRSM